jgi:transcriptional regulator with XRE-family HTH domain
MTYEQPEYVECKSQRISDDILAEVWFGVRHVAFERLLQIFDKKERDNETFSRAHVASLIGMDPAQLSRTLSGRLNVTLRTLSNIAYATNHKLDVVFIDIGDIHPSNQYFEAVNEQWGKRTIMSEDTARTEVYRLPDLFPDPEEDDYEKKTATTAISDMKRILQEA